MPTYQYECSKCGEHFELFQSMKDSALDTCPQEKCPRQPWGKGKVSRLLGTGAGLIFKGSGFYITDYRSDSYKSAAKKDKEGASSSSSSSSAGEKKSDGGKSSSPSSASSAPKPASSGGASSTT